MTPEDIVHAWKDEIYRLSLSDEQREWLPQNPIGPIELPKELLNTVIGGESANYPVTLHHADPLCQTLDVGCTRADTCDWMYCRPSVYIYCTCWITV